MKKYEIVYYGDDLDPRTHYGPPKRITVSSSKIKGWISVRLVPFQPLEEFVDTKGYLVRVVE